MARKKKQAAPAGALASRLVPILAEPKEGASALCLVNTGTYLQVVKEDGEWSLVHFGNVEGWVPADALQR